MEISRQPLLLLLFLLFTTSLASTHKTFIVHLANTHHPSTFASLLTSLPPPHPSKRLLYTYQHTFHGFAAVLTDVQASFLRDLPGILKVNPERIGQIRTTHSSSFLGLNDASGLWPNSNYADDVIIGVLDTGVWPESKSFKDDGFGPVPDKWTGGCDSGPDFPTSSCNKKLIGAKYFSSSYAVTNGNGNGNGVNEELSSPRDVDGHGTHTSSTAGGSVVKDAGFYNLANGEARGMASKSRLAIYKICWKNGCSEADILAALDQAVDDGVDVISISVGIESGLDYVDDPFAIGAFGAVSRGILVSCAAGNSGPEKMSLENIAPWVLTVGASSMDRDFRADVILGDGSVASGISLYYGEPIGAQLVYAKDHGHRLCVTGTLKNVEGKIVLCDGGVNSNVQKGSAVKQAGGAAMILVSDLNTGPGGPANTHVLPAVVVDPTVGTKLRDYIKSQSLAANATIYFKGTVVGGTITAPQVAQFSSRGPNDITPEILKPDLIAPGVNILASWTGANSPSELVTDTRRVEFNFASGTSMACPHVSGLAALLRKAHPDWSPAAIKSALMTTAYNVDNAGNNIMDLATHKPSTPFDHGAGHVSPNAAVDPGLIYDLSTDDYFGFLCSINYDVSQMALFAHGHSIDCSTIGLTTPGDLNYPSFSVVFKPDTDTVTHKRVVKNVGQNVDAVYDVVVSSPPGIEIAVSPSRLEFSTDTQSLSYEVMFSAAGIDMERVLPQFGLIEWSDGHHKVRSPVAFALGEEDYVSSS